MKRLHTDTFLKPRRRKLRRSLTPAEATLWCLLKNSNLSGRKFRRQHSVGPYILDFYCVEEWLAVELDGEVHNNPIAEDYDFERTKYLNRQGIKVIRFENFQVFEDINRITYRIESFFGWKEKDSTTPSAEGAATPPIQKGSF